MARVDAHHHVWNLDVRDEPWITGPAMAPIRRNFDLGDLRPHAAAAGVTTTILVQTLSSLEETREFLALAAADDLVGAVTGWVDLTAPSVTDDLATLATAPGGQYLRAIRHQVHDEPDTDWIARSDVRRGLKAVGDAGLNYELLVFPDHLAVSAAAAADFPYLSFVVDHCAKPRVATGELAEWASGLRELAALPNVTCKLSGLVTEADWASWSVSDLRPYVEVVLEAFGPDRLMFGSDWPVSLLASPYADWVAAVEELIAPLTPAERDAVFGGTARRVYALDE